MLRDLRENKIPIQIFQNRWGGFAAPTDSGFIFGALLSRKSLSPQKEIGNLRYANLCEDQRSRSCNDFTDAIGRKSLSLEIGDRLFNFCGINDYS